MMYKRNHPPMGESPRLYAIRCEEERVYRWTWGDTVLATAAACSLTALFIACLAGWI